MDNDKSVVASSIGEKKPKSETVPMNVDGGDDEVSNSKFLRDPILLKEAKLRWPKRYLEKEKKKTRSRSNSDEDEVLQARCHYTEAKVDGGVIYKLYDDAHVKGEKDDYHFICKIMEMFEAVDGELYFTAQWYYRSNDTTTRKSH
ncbi:putative DNA (cytosine-5-)-methyltransferase [Medicago truncatula]|uniref:Putative DNA (Cytosine-5-)-methyltransferase n=1 Tax=Medicago truncatula TaxID=3880 RepID=A0A396HUV6_MEDTR|nr:putative DNA (cytosine-5-)-methyltransferase [Medicago truncatula]